MGQHNSNNSNLFPELIGHYHIVEARPVDKKNDVVHLKHKSTGQMLQMTRIKYTDQTSYNAALKCHKLRKTMEFPQLQILKQYQQETIKSYCTEVFGINSLWEYYDHTLQHQIKERLELNKKFTQTDLLAMTAQVIKAMTFLQEHEISHQKLKSSTIYLTNQGVIKLSDPLSLLDLPNYQKIKSRCFNYEQTQNIYISPEQCMALESEASYLKSHKDDVWTFGMIILECAQLGNQSICYRNENTKINWTLLQHRIEKFESQYGKLLTSFLKEMLEKKKSHRASWKDLLKKINSLVTVQGQFENQSNQNRPLNEQEANKKIQQMKSGPNTARFGSTGGISHPNMLVNITPHQSNKIPYPLPQPYSLPYSPIKSHVHPQYREPCIPISTRSIYKQPHYNFTYNTHRDEFKKDPVSRIYNKEPQPFYHLQLQSQAREPVPSKSSYYHFPSVADINSITSAGFCMVNPNKENQLKYDNMGSMESFPCTWNEDNEFVSPSSQQGFLFTHLTKQNEMKAFTNEGESNSSENINPYISKDIFMSLQRQKQQINSQTFLNGSFQKKQSDSRSPNRRGFNQVIKQEAIEEKDSQPLTHHNKEKEGIRSFIHEVESITYDNLQAHKQNPNKSPVQPKNSIPISNSESIPVENNGGTQLEYIIENFTQGSKYEGYKLGVMRHGTGKFYYQDGGHYDGEWSKNRMSGYGKLYYQSGNIAYQGYWSNDRFNGRGKLFNDEAQMVEDTNGFDYRDFDEIQQVWEYYQGQFQNDLKKGRGKLVLSNGQYLIGNFNEDMICGEGTFFGINKTIKGVWHENKLIQS